MDAKKLIPYVVILMVLCGIVVYKNMSDTPQTIITQTKLKSLVPAELKEADVSRIKLFAAGKEAEAVELVRADGSWTVASNYSAKANVDAVDGFVEKLFDIKGEARAKNVSADALGDYNLKDDEAFRVQAFSKSDEPALDLLVGKAANPRTIFIREAGGDTVYVESVNLRSEAGVIGDDLAQAPTADKWLDKKILALEQDKIERVALTYPDKRLTFERTEKPAEETPDADAGEEAAPATPEFVWTLSEGGGGRTFKQPGLDKILGKLASFQAESVVDPEKLAEYALETPAFRAEIGVQDGKAVTIEAGRPTLTGNGYVRIADADTPQVYEVSRFNMDQLFLKGSELFELPSSVGTAENVSRIEVAQGGDTVVLSKNGETWQVESPTVGLNTQDSKLTAAAGAIVAWKATDYADSPEKAGTFDRVVRYVLDGQPHSIRAASGAESTDGVYVKIDDHPEVYVMSRTDEAKIFLAPRDVFQLSVLDFDETAVARVTGSVQGEAFTIAKQGDAWEAGMDSTGMHGVETDLVDDLLFTLTEFQVSDLDLTRDPETVTPNTSIIVEMADGTQQGLRFAALDNGLRPTLVLNTPAVFSTNTSAVTRITSQIEAITALPEPEEEPATASADDVPTPEDGPAATADGDAAATESPSETEVSVELNAAPVSAATE